MREMREPDFVMWCFEPVILVELMEEHLRARYGVQGEGFIELDVDDEDPSVCKAYLRLPDEELERLEDAAGFNELWDAYEAFAQLVEDIWGPEAWAEAVGCETPRVRVFVAYRTWTQLASEGAEERER